MSSRPSRHWTRRAGALALGLALLVLAKAVSAQILDIPPTWGGSLADRLRLTGDWGGLRDEMGKKGVTLDVDLTNVWQGVTSGGRDQTTRYYGLATYTLNVDSQKAGLWPGALLTVQGMTGFGNSVNQESGAIAPPDFVGMLPQFGQNTTALTSFMLTQFLSDKFGVFLGRLSSLGVDNNAFAHDYNNQFLNTGLNLNMALAIYPVFSWGGGAVWLPTDGAQVTASIAGATGGATTSLGDSFKDGKIIASGEGRFSIKPFGLAGHQLLGVVWSNKQYTSLQQDPSNIANALLKERYPRLADPGPILERFLERFFPQLLTPVQPLNTESSTWAVYYNFDQYLWSPAGQSDRGIGLFGRFGVSDGNPNPIKYAYNLGVGAKGIVPGRPDDQFGIGWSRATLSNKFVPFLNQQLGLGLGNDDALEAYYNAAVTKSVSAAFDVQYLDQGIGKFLNSSDQLQNMKAAWLVGARLYIRF